MNSKRQKYKFLLTDLNTFVIELYLIDEFIFVLILSIMFLFPFKLLRLIMFIFLWILELIGRGALT